MATNGGQQGGLLTGQKIGSALGNPLDLIKQIMQAGEGVQDVGGAVASFLPNVVLGALGLQNPATQQQAQAGAPVQAAPPAQAGATPGQLAIPPVGQAPVLGGGQVAPVQPQILGSSPIDRANSLFPFTGPGPTPQQDLIRGQTPTPTATSVDTTAAGQIPAGRESFGFGDFLNLIAEPRQAGGLSGLGQIAGQGLASFGDFLNDPQNQALFGSLLAAGAPEGTPEQRLGAMFAQQGTNVGTGQALEQARGGQPAGPAIPQGPVTPQQQQLNLAQPGLGPLGQPAQGTIPFPSSGQVDSGFDRFINLADRTAISDILTQEAGIGLRGRAADVAERDVALRERAAPFNNLDKYARAYANSPQAAQKQFENDTALWKQRLDRQRRYTFETKEVGDNLITWAEDTVTGRREVISKGRNAPGVKAQHEILGKRITRLKSLRDQAEDIARLQVPNPTVGFLTPEMLQQRVSIADTEFNRMLFMLGEPDLEDVLFRQTSTGAGLPSGAADLLGRSGFPPQQGP